MGLKTQLAQILVIDIPLQVHKWHQLFKIMWYMHVLGVTLHTYLFNLPVTCISDKNIKIIIYNLCIFRGRGGHSSGTRR